MERSITYTEQLSNKKLIGEQTVTISKLRGEMEEINEIRQGLEEAAKIMQTKIARL